MFCESPYQSRVSGQGVLKMFLRAISDVQVRRVDKMVWARREIMRPCVDSRNPGGTGEYDCWWDFTVSRWDGGVTDDCDQNKDA